MSKKILIAVIDDDEPFRTALLESLGWMAFAVRGFASADEFLASSEPRACDCIVTDIHMPGRSGFELLQELRAQNIQTPVILVTANIGTASEQDAQSMGAVCLLTKPFDLDALRVCLRKALDEPA